MADGNSGGDNSSAIVAIVAIVILIVLAALFFVYALPAIQSMNQTNQPAGNNSINIQIPAPNVQPTPTNTSGGSTGGGNAYP